MSQIIEEAAPFEQYQIWNDRDWALPLRQFSQATGLHVSLFSLKLERKVGPIISSPINYLLQSVGFWDGPGSLGFDFGRDLAQVALKENKQVEKLFDDSMYVAAFPLRWNGNPVGAIVYGWSFDHFADPIECTRLASRLEIPSNRFWLTAREQAPIGRLRLSVFADLLNSLSQSILNQLSYHEELQDAARTKDEFLATVSHELKTPLTSIQLRIQLLRREESSGRLNKEKLWRTLEVVDRAVQIQSRLIEDLLEGSRIATGKFRLISEPVDLNKVAEHALETVAPAAKAKQVELIPDIQPLSREFMGDETRLEQVFWNLLANAIKFTPEGGTIRFSLRELSRKIEIQVSDTGRGIAPEFLPSVFDRFAQSREGLTQSNRGLGLGLAIAKYVVEMQGGSIRAASDGLGKGATFTIEFPNQFNDGEE